MQDDISLMRTAAAALDEASEWLGYRIGTYDEQAGEQDVERRVRAASDDLKLRLAEHVLGGCAREPGKVH